MTTSSSKAASDRSAKPAQSRGGGRSRPAAANARRTAERPAARRRILAVDVGGSHIKAVISGNEQEIKFVSGPKFSAQAMMKQLHLRLRGRPYDAVSIGVPAPVLHGRLQHEPYNLGKGWQDFDYQAAFGCPVRLINDAAMQALGSYDGGHMLFLSLGTGLGSAMVVNGVVAPMELAHLPYRKHSFEHYVNEQSREDLGRKKWQAKVYEVVEVLRAAMQPDYVMLGGGNVRHLRKLPEGVRLGGNAHAFEGGFRLWEGETQ
jgi:ROK family protein